MEVSRALDLLAQEIPGLPIDGGRRWGAGEDDRAHAPIAGSAGGSRRPSGEISRTRTSAGSRSTAR
jgi:hypothetical protein